MAPVAITHLCVSPFAEVTPPVAEQAEKEYVSVPSTYSHALRRSEEESGLCHETLPAAAELWTCNRFCQPCDGDMIFKTEKIKNSWGLNHKKLQFIRSYSYQPFIHLEVLFHFTCCYFL